MLTNDQLKERRFSLGGSDASIILGYNKYKSLTELYLEKIGAIEPKQIDSYPIIWGNLCEESVATLFTMHTGLEVYEPKEKFVHPIYPFITGNLDRVVVGKNIILECKTGSAWTAKEWEDDGIPVAYRIQVLHYLAVTGYEEAYIAAMLDNSKFVVRKIERDEELIEMIIKAEVDFWKNNVLKKVPPPIDGSNSCSELLNELYPRSTEQSILLPSTADSIIYKLNEAKDLEKQWKEERSKYENQLKDMLKKNETGITPSHEVHWKNVSSNRVDTKTLKSKYPDVYKQVCKESISRRFTVK